MKTKHDIITITPALNKKVDRWLSEWAAGATSISPSFVKMFKKRKKMGRPTKKSAK